MPDSWECIAWKAKGGYGSQRKNGTNENGARERLWFSPACLKPDTGQLELVNGVAAAGASRRRKLLTNQRASSRIHPVEKTFVVKTMSTLSGPGNAGTERSAKSRSGVSSTIPWPVFLVIR